MRRHIEIVPKRRGRLFDALVKRENELADKNRGTFFRSGRKSKNATRWRQKKYVGSLTIRRTESEVVSVAVNTRSRQGADWQLLQAFIGFVVRNFAHRVEAMHIHF
jgi:cytochrome b involved in lipid metabolism